MKKYIKPVSFIIEVEPQIMLQNSNTLGKGTNPASHNFSILSKERDEGEEDGEDIW